MEPQRAIPDDIESFYHDQSFGRHQPSTIVPDITTYAQFCPVIIAASEHLPPVCGDLYPRISPWPGNRPLSPNSAQLTSVLALSDIWRAILGLRDGVGFSGG